MRSVCKTIVGSDGDAACIIVSVSVHSAYHMFFFVFFPLKEYDYFFHTF